MAVRLQFLSRTMTVANMPRSSATQLMRSSTTGRVVLLLLALVAFVLLTGLLDGGVGVSPRRLFVQPLFPLANAWPGLLALGLLLALTRRLAFSFLLVFLAQALVYGVNALKVANLGTPLMPADFQMVGQLGKGGTHVLSSYLPHSPWPYLAMIAGIAAIVALWRYEPALLPRRTGRRRAVAGGVLLLGLGSLLGGASAWSQVYNGRHLWLEPWSASSTTAHSGLISSLMMFHLQYGHGGHPADPSAAMQLLSQSSQALRQRLQPGAAGSSELPDIVVVQSESFFDPAILRGYEHSNLTPNLDRLARHGQSGPLHVPTFGGGTIRTEFEVLTGLSLRYFDDLQFPYLQLNNKVVPSMVRTLRSHGYATVAIHGNDPAFWNRISAFKAIGFDRFVSRAQFPADAATDGKYMADSAMTDEIMTQLKDAGPPQFLFAISIEGHGPYDIEPADIPARDAIPVPAGVSGRDKRELQTYIYHIQHADQELGRLARLLARRERPTLLLFYGDHLPALTNTFQATGFVDGRGMLSEPGVWLMVDPRDPGKSQTLALASWMLPGHLLERAGIRDDAYFALTQVVAPQLAGLTRAPGAPPATDDQAVQQVDHDMASVALLRMNGKLKPLLPPAALAGQGSQATAATDQPTSVAGAGR